MSSDTSNAAPASEAPREPASGVDVDDPRQLAAVVVNAVYRIAKASQLHAQTNQAVSSAVEGLVASVHRYCARSGASSLAVLFTEHAVFANRQMLRSSRETYQLALELGRTLRTAGVTELTLTNDLQADEAAALGQLVAELTKGRVVDGRAHAHEWKSIQLRNVQYADTTEQLAPSVRAARTFASALMLMRATYDDLRQGKYELRQTVKRVAQRIVAQDASDARLFMSLAATPVAEADRPGLALASAVLAVGMARQLTDDRTVLSALANAALLYDAGRARLVGYDTPGAPRVRRTLNRDEEQQLPLSSVVALTVLGKLHPPSLARSTIVYEATSLQSGSNAYGGRRSPTLPAKLLATARSFIDLRATRGTSAGLSIDDALQVLEGGAVDNTSRALLKALVGALGIFPAGTLVEISTGELAVVLSTPTLAADYARPPVRVMYDPRGQLLDEPYDLDLAAPALDGVLRFVAKPVDATAQQTKQLRAFVAQLAGARAQAAASRSERIEVGERVEVARSSARPSTPSVPPSSRREPDSLVPSSAPQYRTDPPGVAPARRRSASPLVASAATSAPTDPPPRPAVATASMVAGPRAATPKPASTDALLAAYLAGGDALGHEPGPAPHPSTDSQPAVPKAAASSVGTPIAAVSLGRVPLRQAVSGGAAATEVVSERYSASSPRERVKTLPSARSFDEASVRIRGSRPSDPAVTLASPPTAGRPREEPSPRSEVGRAAPSVREPEPRPRAAPLPREDEPDALPSDAPGGDASSDATPSVRRSKAGSHAWSAPRSKR
jgi:hypothetical protein